MTLRRRQQLIRLARRYDTLIITDDVYDMLSWSLESKTTTPPVFPRLVDIDHTLEGGPATPFGNAMSNGSFSKILGPGVRTGWAEGTPLFIEGLSRCGSSVSGGAPSQLVASMISQTLLNGNLQDHINRVLIPAYRERHSLMLTAIKQNLIGYGARLDGSGACVENKGVIMRRGGGFFLYLHLPPTICAQDFALRALQEWNVLVASGDSFEVWGDEGSVPCLHGVRICFAWEEPELLVEGVRRLGWS
jgi:DNA-binding transcriptional MocR family regulator